MLEECPLGRQVCQISLLQRVFCIICKLYTASRAKPSQSSARLFSRTCLFATCPSTSKDGPFDSIGLRLTTRHRRNRHALCTATRNLTSNYFRLIKKQGQVVVPFDSKQTKACSSRRQIFLRNNDPPLCTLCTRKKGLFFFSFLSW